MATLQQLRDRVYQFLRESSSDSHFTDDQIRGYLNQAQEYMAALSAPPEDLVDVAIQSNIGAYPILSDTLVLGTCFFGTTSTSADVAPLRVINKQIIKEIFPGWLDETIQNAGIPRYILKLDKQTIYVHPRPDASQVGKRIYMFYGFIPAPLVNDSDEPQIAANYHNLLPVLACRWAYYSLANPDMAKEMYGAFIADYNAIKDNVDKGIEEDFRLKWGAAEV